MRNTADVTGGKPIAVLLQSISGVSAINPSVAFYDIHGGKIEVLLFYFVPDTTRDRIDLPYRVCKSQDSVRHELKLSLELRVFAGELLKSRAGSVVVPVVGGPWAARVSTLEVVFPELCATKHYLVNTQNYLRC
jgi:hypothetical protein